MGFKSGEEGDGQEFQFPFRLSLLSQRQRDVRILWEVGFERTAF